LRAQALRRNHCRLAPLIESTNRQSAGPSPGALPFVDNLYRLHMLPPCNRFQSETSASSFSLPTGAGRLSNFKTNDRKAPLRRGFSLLRVFAEFASWRIDQGSGQGPGERKAQEPCLPAGRSQLASHSGSCSFRLRSHQGRTPQWRQKMAAVSCGTAINRLIRSSSNNLSQAIIRSRRLRIIRNRFKLKRENDFRKPGSANSSGSLCGDKRRSKRPPFSFS